MSYFVSKIGHLDPRFYSLIYCAIPGVQMSGVQMSDFISKIGHLDPRFYSVIYCAIPGVQMSGVQMSGVHMSGVQMSGVQMYPTPRKQKLFNFVKKIDIERFHLIIVSIASVYFSFGDLNFEQVIDVPFGTDLDTLSYNLLPLTAYT